MTLHLKLGHNEQGNIHTDIVRTDAPSLEVESRNTRLSYLQDPPAGRVMVCNPIYRPFLVLVIGWKTAKTTTRSKVQVKRG